MDVSLQLININDKPILRELIKNYQKEILNSEKVGEYKYLDSYWQKPDRYPYFINVEGKVSGFVLINSYNLIEKDAKNISEFYIKKEFRSKGIGKAAAIRSFELFPGKWEVRELKENEQAQKFWRKVIKEYTNNKFNETSLSSEKWDGPIQTFDNSALV